MPSRLPACDPCRFAKVACDHLRPVCSRCRDSNKPSRCTYRARPFRKNKNVSNTFQNTVDSSGKYPNPGYLGNSSHATIYGYLPPDNGDGGDTTLRNLQESPAGRPSPLLDDSKISYGASLIEEVRRSLNISSCMELVKNWTSGGVNLALAGSLVNACAKTAYDIFHSLSEETRDVLGIVSDLFGCSCRPLITDATTSLEDFCFSFCQRNARWETLGLFFIAISRATIDLDRFSLLYETNKERCDFRKLAMQFSDQCLDISLSLDCLNDLQLFLQYENFILHSVVDGDQSYHSWRKLGDVISSLFALGYHEQTGNDTLTPNFLKDLRRAAFARAYSADKNVSIFLGRPPRMHGKYCRFELPGIPTQNSQGTRTSTMPQFQWPQDSSFNYLAETQWSAICASLKEEVLDLREESYGERARKGGVIQAKSEAHWLALPLRFRLESALKVCDRKPIERDFMVSARLNHLHILFLLRLALVQNIPEPDAQLVTVSANMLGLIAESLVLKAHLANSGTSLVWKLTYYGLPAAGIICLSLIKQSFLNLNVELPTSKVIQDLSILVAEIEAGALVRPEDPNYALLSEATRAIKGLLHRIISNQVARYQVSHQQPVPVPHSLEEDSQDWFPWPSQDFWDFEIDFWHNFAEHPALMGSDNETFGASW